MIRGSTPTHIFTVPIDTKLLTCVHIVYAQNDTVVLVKHTEDCELDGYKITTTLTQEETFLFDCSKNVQIQLRLKTNDNTVLSSEVMTVYVGKCLENEVI